MTAAVANGVVNRRRSSSAVYSIFMLRTCFNENSNIHRSLRSIESGYRADLWHRCKCISVPFDSIWMQIPPTTCVALTGLKPIASAKDIGSITCPYFVVLECRCTFDRWNSVSDFRRFVVYHENPYFEIPTETTGCDGIPSVFRRHKSWRSTLPHENIRAWAHGAQRQQELSPSCYMRTCHIDR